ncbi:hypothetical protein TWF281_006779 [Arthrobotrys megalospora]
MKVTKGNCKNLVAAYTEMPLLFSDGEKVYHLQDPRRPIGPTGYHYTIATLLNERLEFSEVHKNTINSIMIEHHWLNGKKTDPRAKVAIESMMEALCMSNEKDAAVKLLWQIKIETYCYNTCLAWRKAGCISTSIDNVESFHEPHLMTRLRGMMDEYIQTHEKEEIETMLKALRHQIDIVWAQIQS